MERKVSVQLARKPGTSSVIKKEGENGTAAEGHQQGQHEGGKRPRGGLSRRGRGGKARGAMKVCFFSILFLPIPDIILRAASVRMAFLARRTKPTLSMALAKPSLLRCQTPRRPRKRPLQFPRVPPLMETVTQLAGSGARRRGAPRRMAFLAPRRSWWPICRTNLVRIRYALCLSLHSPY